VVKIWKLKHVKENKYSKTFFFALHC